MVDLRKLFIRVNAARISMPIKLALPMLVLTFVRPGELRCAQRPEFDLEASAWTVPTERDRARGLTGMKLREEHVVPLSRQVVENLRGLQAPPAAATSSSQIATATAARSATARSTTRRAPMGCQAQGWCQCAASAPFGTGKDGHRRVSGEEVSPAISARADGAPVARSCPRHGLPPPNK